QGLAVDGEPGVRIRYPERGEVIRLGCQCQRIDHHEPRQVGPHTRPQGTGTELGEGVPPPVPQYNRGCRLRTPVEADHRVGRPAPAQPVHDGALARVAVSEVDDDDMVHSRITLSSAASSAGSPDLTTGPRSAPTRVNAFDTVPAAAEPTSRRSASPRSR